MDRPLYFDKHGTPLELMEWAKLMSDRDYCIIKQARHKENGCEFWLSTVWLGLDHNYTPNGPCMIFETMALEYKPRFNEVVAQKEDWNWQERYSTEDEALAARDPWRVVHTHKPDIISVFLKGLKGGENAKPTKRPSRVLSFLRRSKQAGS